MRRREFIAGLGGTAAAWPLAPRAQQPEGIRRAGVIIQGDGTDAERKGWVSVFTRGLADLGWTDGCNLRMDVHCPGHDVDRMQMLASELADPLHDAILVS